MKLQSICFCLIFATLLPLTECKEPQSPEPAASPSPQAVEPSPQAAKPSTAASGDTTKSDTIIDTPVVLGKCKPCHHLDRGAEHIKSNLGPGLLGVYGRAPTVKVPFATWDDFALEQWLTNPRDIKSDTKMFFKVSNPEKRAQVIEALKQLK